MRTLHFPYAFDYIHIYITFFLTFANDERLNSWFQFFRHTGTDKTTHVISSDLYHKHGQFNLWHTKRTALIHLTFQSILQRLPCPPSWFMVKPLTFPQNSGAQPIFNCMSSVRRRKNNNKINWARFFDYWCEYSRADHVRGSIQRQYVKV